MDRLDTLKRLCSVNAPSGREEAAADLAMSLLRPLTDAVWQDRFGNVVGVRRCGKPAAKRVILDAHIDEVGLIVTGAKEGFLSFCSVGGIDPRILPDQEVTLLTEPPLRGVVAVLPPHVQKAEDMEKSTPIEKLWIDAGLKQEEAEALKGTFAVAHTPFRIFQNETVSGKALDDRAGFAALLYTAELLRDKPLDVDLYFLGSLREETGGGGAVTASFAIKPDCFIAVDATFARTPETDDADTFPAGSGAIIGVGPNITGWLCDRLKRKAEEENIPWLPEVMPGNSGTNAWRVQTSREGIATAVVSLPVKYMHTPAETLALQDLEAVSRLLAAFVLGLEQEEGAFLC